MIRVRFEKRQNHTIVAKAALREEEGLHDFMIKWQRKLREERRMRNHEILHAQAIDLASALSLRRFIPKIVVWHTEQSVCARSRTPKKDRKYKGEMKGREAGSKQASRQEEKLTHAWPLP